MIVILLFPMVTFLRENVFAYNSFTQVDFTAVYHGPRMALEHGQVYNFENFIRYVQNDLNVTTGWRASPPPLNWPPTLFLFFLPFGFLPFEESRLLWFGLTLAGYFACFVLMTLPGGKNNRFLKASSLLFIMLSAYGIHDNLVWGQVNVVILFLLALACLAIDAKREITLGILIGLLAVMKLGPAILLLFLIAGRRWQAAAAMVLTVLGMGLAAVMLFGMDMTMFYVRDVLPGLLQFSAVFRNNQSISNLLSLWLANQHAPPDQIALAGFLAQRILVPAILVVFTGGCFLRWRSKRADKRADRLLFALGVTTFTLVSPLFELHHFVWLLLPVSVILFELIDRFETLSKAIVVSSAGGIVLSTHALLIPMYSYSPILYLLDFSKLFGTILLWLTLLAMLPAALRGGFPKELRENQEVEAARA